MLDAALIDVGQHRIGAAESDQRGLGEEHPHVVQRAGGQQQHGRAPQRDEQTGQDHQPAEPELRVGRRRRVVVDQRRAIRLVAGAVAAAHLEFVRPDLAAGTAPPPARCRERDFRQR
jgi:hypothetical protein